MRKKRLAIGIVGLIIMVFIFGGGVYFFDYIHGDGGMAATIVGGLYGLSQGNPVLFIVGLFAFLILVSLVISGVRRTSH